MAKYYTAKETARQLGLTHLDVIRRIRKRQIPAHKEPDGWNWRIHASDVEEIKTSDWYIRYMKRRNKAISRSS